MQKNVTVANLLPYHLVLNVYFRHYALVHLKLQNQLGTDKASKLVLLYKCLNL